MSAIPETYFTAYGSLFECLQLKPSDTFLVRGGTSSLGLTSIQLAKALVVQLLLLLEKEIKLDF